MPHKAIRHCLFCQVVIEFKIVIKHKICCKEFSIAALEVFAIMYINMETVGTIIVSKDVCT